MVSATTLDRLFSTVESGKLMVFATCSIDRAYHDGTEPHEDNRVYDRKDKKRYPYKSHWQRFRAWYGLVTCSLLIIFNGWRSLLTPWSVNDFIPSYISVSTTLS